MNLFESKQKVAMEKRASARLSPYIEEWPYEVLDNFYASYPQFRGKDLLVVFDKIDKDNLSGMGKIILKEASGDTPKNAPKSPTTFIPVIVSKRELKDLDIVVNEGRLFPLPEKTINDLFGFDIIDATFTFDVPFMGIPSSSIYSSATTTPLNPGMKTTFASDPLTEIAENVPDILKKRVMEKIARNPDTKSLLERESIKRFLSTPFKPQESHPDSVVIKKASNGYDAIVITLSPFSMMSKKLANAKEKVYSKNYGARIVKVASDEESKNFGVYKIDHLGKKIESLFVPVLTDFHRVYKDSGILVHGNGVSYIEKVAGDLVSKPTIKGKDPVGHGIFIFQKESNAIASYPLEVVNSPDGRKLVKTAGSEWELVYHDSLRMPVIKNATLYLPTDWKFVPTSSKVVDLISYNDVKIAGMDNTTNRLSYDSNTGTYNFIGRDVSEIAGRYFTEIQTKAILMAVGLSDEDSDKIISKTASGSGCRFSVKKKPSKTKNVKAYDKLASDLRMDLLKEAAAVEESTDPDALFSLNFITPENIDSFAKAIPLFEDSLEKLAGLLLATRLGMKRVPEVDVKTAVRGLHKVSEALKVIQYKI